MLYLHNHYKNIVSGVMEAVTENFMAASSNTAPASFAVEFIDVSFNLADRGMTFAGI